LALYLSMYKEVLKSVAVIHSFNVTHYDIKCDNVLIDTQKTIGGPQEEKMLLTIGDFGECQIFLSDKDELNTRSRGTEVIMSPEMMTL
jgi:serine/threonine protein kinase